MDGILKDKGFDVSTPRIDAACKRLRQQALALRASQEEDSPIIEQMRKVMFKDGKCYLWVPLLEKGKGVWMDAHAVAKIVCGPSLPEIMGAQPITTPVRKDS